MISGLELYVKIEALFESHVDEEWLRRVAAETLALEGVNSPVELGLVITDDETIRQLNQRYRGQDEATDVLSFALLEQSDPPFLHPPDGVLHLGEVILSYPRAAIQAEKHRHSLKQELALLVVHGLLHLLGHDDKDTKGRRRMRAEEKRVLGELSHDGLL